MRQGEVTGMRLGLRDGDVEGRMCLWQGRKESDREIRRDGRVGRER